MLGSSTGLEKWRCCVLHSTAMYCIVYVAAVAHLWYVTLFMIITHLNSQRLTLRYRRIYGENNKESCAEEKMDINSV